MTPSWSCNEFVSELIGDPSLRSTESFPGLSAQILLNKEFVSTHWTSTIPLCAQEQCMSTSVFLVTYLLLLKESHNSMKSPKYQQQCDKPHRTAHCPFLTGPPVPCCAFPTALQPACFISSAQNCPASPESAGYFDGWSPFSISNPGS